MPSPALTSVCAHCGFTALKMFSNNPQVFLLHTIAWLVTAQLNPYLRRLIKTLNRTSHNACSLPAFLQKCPSLSPLWSLSRTCWRRFPTSGFDLEGWRHPARSSGVAPWRLSSWNLWVPSSPSWIHLRQSEDAQSQGQCHVGPDNFLLELLS